MTGPGSSPGTARDALVQEWADVLSTTAYVPMSADEIEHYLRDLVERMTVALSGTAVDPQVAADIGSRLVAGDFIGPQSLPRTIEVLARALTGNAANPAVNHPTGQVVEPQRLIELLGALVGGYTEALRDRLFHQQEAVKRALLRARQAVEQDLRVSAARFSEVFDSSPMGIVISAPGGRIVQTNLSFDEILGYSCGELIGRDLSELFDPDVQVIVQDRYRRLCCGQESRFREQYQLRRKDAEPAWVYLAASVLLDTEQQPQYIATMVDDISELHLLQEWLSHQTLHDLQTGLPNRQYFVSHLEKVLGLLDPSAVVTLLHLDLDGFTAINEGLGHDFGDRLLDVVARRLRKVVADQRAMVARVGGDEYAILIEPGPLPPDISVLAEAINAELDEPVYLDRIGVAVTATIGVVQRPVGGTNLSELLRAADATLRRLRGQGTRQWGVFDADIDATDRAQLRLAAALPGALETGELQVRYRPVVALDGDRLVGIEAALSWLHPQLGVLAEEQCAQVAEQTGAVYAVGQWMLRTAAEQAMFWREQFGPAVPPVAVNLTPSQARDPDLVAKVRKVLHETGLPPAGLELRMPTTALRTDTGELAEAGSEAEDNLRVLADLGISTGLHNFAGGIGGLGCLAELPVRTVRIAEMVAQQVIDDPTRILSQAVHALVHIVRDAGINVIGFPTESTDQAGCWRWVGANWAAGTLFGNPGPPENIEYRLNTP